MNSHFTPKDLQQIEFKKFIFHVIVKDDDKPTLLDEVPLTERTLLILAQSFMENESHVNAYVQAKVEHHLKETV